MSLELNYKVRNIDAAERKYQRKFLSDLGLLATGNLSIEDFLFFCEAGGGDTEAALDTLDEKGMMELVKLISTEVERAGFFQGVEEEVNKALKAQNLNTSATSGAKTSPQPSK